MYRVIVADDNPEIRETISEYIEEQLGLKTYQCENGRQIIEIFNSNGADIIITDINMPLMDGFKAVEEIKKTCNCYSNPIVIFISAFTDTTNLIKSIRLGAFDYLKKPIDLFELHTSLFRAIQQLQATPRPPSQAQVISSNFPRPAPKLCSGTIQFPDNSIFGFFSEKMNQLVNLATAYHHDRTIPVLIEGETGTGKELIAKLIHYGSEKETRPFITLNCTAIPSNIFETEVFGYEKGAFTGADTRGKKGYLDIAQGGTLFLDEIGDLPIEMQIKLLRAIENKRFYRVGGNKEIEIDVRFIFATNRDLLTLIKQGKFRDDLYYRIATGKINVPALRERKAEIWPLAQLFLIQAAKRKKKDFKFINPETLKILESYHWPGNVRELLNVIENAVLLYNNIELLPEHIDLPVDTGLASSIKSKTIKLDNFELPEKSFNLREFEKRIIKKALAKFNWNKTRVAKYLGLSRTQLRVKLNRYQLNEKC